MERAFGELLVRVGRRLRVGMYMHMYMHMYKHMYMHMSKERTSRELLVQVGRRLRVGMYMHMYMHMSKERTSGELLVQVGRRLRVDGVVLAPLPHVHLRPAARATRGHGAFSVRRAACGTRMHATPCEQPLHTSSSESYAGMATRSCHHAPGSP